MGGLQAHTRGGGELRGLALGGGLQAHTRGGGVEGSGLGRESPGPHPGEGSPGTHPAGGYPSMC